MVRGPRDRPLDEHLGYATHIVIECRWCPRRVVMMTSDLYELAPGAVTYADFRTRLVCSRCKAKGWARIRPAGR
ncbi:hypothetical protein BH09PSE4_BH09PSE4_13770 [soil metagenome]